MKTNAPVVESEYTAALQAAGLTGPCGFESRWGAPYPFRLHHGGEAPIVAPMPKPKKRGRKPEHIKITPGQAGAALDRLLKEPKPERPSGGPKVRSKRPKKK